MSAADERKMTRVIASRAEHQQICKIRLDALSNGATTMFGGEVFSGQALTLLEQYIAAMIDAAMDGHYLDAHDEKPQ